MDTEDEITKCDECDGEEPDSRGWKGNGVCSHCHGDGIEHSGMLGHLMDEMLGAEEVPCSKCSGSRICSACGGTGII
jgi:hypothetical protein